MPRRTRVLATAAAVGSSAALLCGGFCTTAAADPAAPVPAPIDGLQAPGLPAIQTLSPAIRQAASDPNNAASMLMAAAAAFAGNSAASPDSKNLAAAVNQFVTSDPATASVLGQTLPGTGIPLPGGASVPGPAAPAPAAAAPMPDAVHAPAAGVTPGMEAHLPPGIDPVFAVGPVPDAVPHGPAPAAPGAAPVAAPAPGPEPAPAPVPDGAPVPAPAAVPVSAPAPAADAPPPAAAAPGFSPDSPPTQDFMYPSIGNGCLADGGNSIATALSVAGPAKIPAPGPGPGQTAYVFTAVGTSAPAAVQKLPLNVTWVNLTTGRSGSATLKPRPDINPNGPTTLTAIVDTGSGSIMSTIFGQVTTVDRQCQFMPTIGSTVVP